MLLLIGVVFVILLVFGVFVGVLVVSCVGCWLDMFILVLVLLFYVMLLFWVVLMGVLLFLVMLGWLLFFGFEIVGFGYIGMVWVLDIVWYLVLLVLLLGLFFIVVYLWMMWVLMLEVSQMDFVKIVCVKGLVLGVIQCCYVLCNVLLFIVMLVGFQVGQFVGGVVLIEIVFVWFGIGWLMFEVLI